MIVDAPIAKAAIVDDGRQRAAKLEIAPAAGIDRGLGKIGEYPQPRYVAGQFEGAATAVDRRRPSPNRSHRLSGPGRTKRDQAVRNPG